MNQTTINITARQDLAQVSLRKKIGEMVQGVNKWLDAKSGFYSRICGFSVTRRVVARVNTVTLSLMAGRHAWSRRHWRASRQWPWLDGWFGE